MVLCWGGTFVRSRTKPDATGMVVLQIADTLWSVDDHDAPEDDIYFLNRSCGSNL